MHLTGAGLIAAHLTPENADQLLAEVTHKTKEQIQVIVARLAPRGDLPDRIAPISVTSTAPVSVAPVTQSAQVVADIDAPSALAQMGAVAPESSQAPSATEAVATVPEPGPSRVTPPAPERYGVQFTVDQETRELLEKVKELLSDPAARKLENVFKRALALLARELERRKCASTDKPRASKRPKSPHTVTSNVKRQVWKRDQGQCTFVNESGERCPERHGLEYEHVRARGRAAFEGVTTTLTAKDVRLLCPAHNQLMAERLYGGQFMRHKRDAALGSGGAAG